MPAAVLLLQIALAQLGTSPGRLDGVAGPRTAAALGRVRPAATTNQVVDRAAAACAGAVQLTPAQLAGLAGHSKAGALLPGLNLALRLCAARGERAWQIAAQLAHESAGFKTLTEYASGAAYEGRADLGNTVPGDGVRFKGRGLIQLTGRSNYASATRFLRASGWLSAHRLPADLDLTATPGRAAEPLVSGLTAAWYLLDRGCLEAADRGDLLAVTKLINGGTNGLDSRRTFLERARALGL